MVFRGLGVLVASGWEDEGLLLLGGGFDTDDELSCWGTDGLSVELGVLFPPLLDEPCCGLEGLLLFPGGVFRCTDDAAFVGVEVVCELLPPLGIEWEPLLFELILR